jgi:hypothetical protein
MKIEVEIWMPVKGYEGIYDVSNTGRVRSLTRLSNHSKPGFKRIVQGQILSCRINKNRMGYVEIYLKVAGRKSKCKKVHRMVAESFLPNPNLLPMVNHKDFNPQNNSVNNLEWCNAKYNSNYSQDRMPNQKNLRGCEVNAYTKEGEFIATYPSIRGAARSLSVHSQNICAVISGKAKTAKGFIFKKSYAAYK